jgi:hypothetical protein
MKFIFLPIFLMISVHVIAQTSYVAPTRILNKKAYQFGITGEYWKSSKRVDKDGKKFPFEDGESFNRLQGDVSGFYGLTENLQVGGGVRYRQNASKVLNSSTNEVDSETSSGVQSTYVNLMFAFKPVDQLRYAVEGTYRYTPYTNEESTVANPGKLLLGDDGNEYSAGLAVTYASKTNNFLSGRVGYRKPGQDLSSEIYWQVEAALAWKYLALVAGVDGVSSMNNDPYENDEANRPLYETGSSGLYHSINREWLAPYAGVNLALGQSWRVEFKGSQVVSGKSTDLGTNFAVSLIRRVDDKRTDKADSKFKDYDFEASITKVSPKKGFVVIDKGLSEDIQKGMKIDFYEFDYVGGNILLASGIVLQAKADTSVVKITKTYNTKKELKEGVVARGTFR